LIEKHTSKHASLAVFEMTRIELQRPSSHPPLSMAMAADPGIFEHVIKLATRRHAVQVGVVPAVE